MKNNIVIGLIVIILLASMVPVIVPMSMEYNTEITDDVTATLKSKTEVEKGSDSWTPIEGGDHGGEDWIPENGCEISGIHGNINRFIIPINTIVHIYNYSKNNELGGRLLIFASEIVINGVLNATGRGLLGGNGGGPACGGKGGAGSNSNNGADTIGQYKFGGGGGGGGGSHAGIGGNGGDGGVGVTSIGNVNGGWGGGGGY